MTRLYSHWIVVKYVGQVSASCRQAGQPGFSLVSHSSSAQNAIFNEYAQHVKISHRPREFREHILVTYMARAAPANPKHYLAVSSVSGSTTAHTYTMKSSQRSKLAQVKIP